MAKYEDYVKVVAAEETVIDEAIANAGDQQVIREESTPDGDWESRYKNLEVAYSRQGQQMGDYRKLIDDYVSTPNEPEVQVEANPITPDDIYENPDEAVRRAVDSHPAMQRVEKLEEDLASAKRDTAIAEFEGRHPNYDTTFNTPEFANWVNDSTMRQELVNRAQGLDMASADALFTLWEAEQTAPAQNAEQAATIEAASLEQGFGSEAPAPDRYSRSAMLQQKIRAKQGDMEADAYVKAHAANYREALQQGTVRD